MKQALCRKCNGRAVYVDRDWELRGNGRSGWTRVPAAPGWRHMEDITPRHRVRLEEGAR